MVIVIHLDGPRYTSPEEYVNEIVQDIQDDWPEKNVRLVGWVADE